MIGTMRDLGDALSGIERSADVCGGEACVARTRIPVWLLVQARRLGTTEAELAQSFPSLQGEDLAEAWSYDRDHRDEIDQQIQDNEAA
jgi:uncharacterized protein (DUF433 family)